VTRQGQSCTAGLRLFLHRSIFESFLTKLAARLATLKIGDPLDETTDMGALISRKQFDRVCSYIDNGLRQPGGRLVLGGLPPQEDRLRRATSYSRRCSPMSGTIGGLRGKKSSAR
jgi:acyl-CoA reductase-like NAD-dependent aldehyde dehydrogenase